MMVYDLVTHLSPLHPMSGSAFQGVLPLYISPDQILPLTSALGAVVGVVLIVWHQLVAFVRKGWQWVHSRWAHLRNGAQPATAAHAPPVPQALDQTGGPEAREGSG